MKTLVTISAILLLIHFGNAQTAENKISGEAKFLAAMQSNLKMLDTAKSAETYIMLSNNFERIGNAEKKYWEPYYYASFCYALMAANTPDKTKIDFLATKAEEYLQKAEAIAQNNSEISALHAMIINTKILVDPISRFQTYSIESASYLKLSKEQNPGNPRPYLIEARTKLFTPEAMGGGATAAKPIIEKAIALFNDFKQENSISPNWGSGQAEKLYEKVKEK